MTVYYIYVGGSLLTTRVFNSEKEAEEYAEKEKFDDYFIIPKEHI